MSNLRKLDISDLVTFPIWLSTDEVARYLGVTDMTIRRLAAAGAIPSYRFGRIVKYKLDDVKAYIEGARVAPKETER